jgi:cation diffusion facilitator CzcD-associated flavoprotein CzcO
LSLTIADIPDVVVIFPRKFDTKGSSRSILIYYSHNYSYSFCPNPDWPGYYATAEQIFAYMKDVEQKYDCAQYIKLGHSIRSAEWQEQTGKWKLKVANADGVEFVDECDVFINAGGVLK